VGWQIEHLMALLRMPTSSADKLWPCIKLHGEKNDD
jgi:hypothetical protein